jgi:hypothetical protein
MSSLLVILGCGSASQVKAGDKLTLGRGSSFVSHRTNGFVSPALSSNTVLPISSLGHKVDIGQIAGNLSPWPLIKHGDRGRPVQTLQYLLNAWGNHLIVDGVFGLKTEAAVRSFQRNHGLTESGFTDPSTWGEIIVRVRKGSKGNAVRALQYELRYRDVLAGAHPSEAPEN